MVLLSCAIIGDGGVVSVIIGEGKTVAVLKDAIKEKIKDDPNLKNVAAKNLQLFLAKKGDRWLTEAGAEAVVLDGNGHPRGFEKMMTLLWLKNTNTFGESYQPGEGQVHVLVVLPQRGEQEVYLFKDGINPQVPHLAREELLSRVYAMMHHRFIFFMSPAASGKTTLLALFARKYPGMNCIYASFRDPEISAFDQLRSCGIDLTSRTLNLSEDQQHVIMLDDAQAKYHETGFWGILIKGTSFWLPANVRFIICGTHALEGGAESPVEFKSLPKVVREDFLLSDEEAREFLALPLPMGLPDKMKEQNFIELVVRECNGLIGALRVSVDAAVARFAKCSAEPETELI